MDFKSKQNNSGGLSGYGGFEETESAGTGKQVLALLRGRFHYTIILALVLGLVGAALGYLSQPSLYRSEAQVKIDPIKSTILGDERTIPMFEQYVASQHHVIRGYDVIKRAMKNRQWTELEAQLGKNEKMDALDYARCIDLYRQRRQYVITVGFEHKNPAVAEAGVRALIDTYEEVHAEREELSEGKRIDKLEQIIDNNLKEIDDVKERKLGDIKNFDRGLVDNLTLDDHFRQIQDQIREVEQILGEIQTDIDIKSGGVDREDGPQYGAMQIPELINLDAELLRLVEEKRQYERERELLKAQGYGDGHRRIKNLRAMIADANRRIEDRVRLLQGGNVQDGEGGFLNPLDLQRRRQQVYQERLTRLKQELSDTAELRRKVGDYDARLEKLYADLNDAQEQLTRSQMSQDIGGRIVILARGDRPTVPYNTTKRAQFAGIGFMFGNALGIGIMLIIGALDRRMRHADDAHVGMNDVRMLGVLPSLPDNMADPDQSVLAAHAVHHIRTLLQISQHGDENGAVFAVSGPASGSGKTSLTFALGLSFAASESRTLLIDADIVGGGLTHRVGAVVHRKLEKILIRHDFISESDYIEASRIAKATDAPITEVLVNRGFISEQQLRRALELRRQTALGLLDAASDEQFADCIAKTEARNLDILPIGAAMPHQAGSLSPNVLRDIIARAREAYDIVLIDTGPVLGSLEASITATEADGVVMIVSRGDQKHLAQKSLEHLKSIDARIAGIVFNHALDDDVAKTSYATLSVVQSRRQLTRGGSAATDPIDPTRSARYGPLATAVASYGSTAAQVVNGESGDSPPVGRSSGKRQAS